mgnify:FL=1
MFKAYKHILWDWNGTLLQDCALCVTVLNQLLSEHGHPELSVEAYKEHFSFPVIDFYSYLGFKTDPENFKSLSHQFIGQYEARWLNECQLQPHAIELLERLTAMGLRHSILSAAHQDALEKGTSYFGIKPLFENLLGTDNIYAEGKVRRAELWMAQGIWQKDSVLLIGDTPHDYEAAQAIDVDCILLASGHCNRLRLESTGSKVYENIGALLKQL